MRVSHLPLILVTALFLLSACGRVDTSRPPEGGAATAPVAPAGDAPAAPTKIDEAKFTTTPDGLKYADLVVGDGPEATSGKEVSVHYTGWLQNGTKFDSSLDRGQPYDLQLGAGQVIKGWDEGLQGMKVGGKRQLIIPPELGYGSADQGVIPPNSTLIFEVQLIDVR